MIHLALMLIALFVLGWVGLFVLGLIVTAFEMHKALGFLAIAGTAACAALIVVLAI